MKLSLRNTAVCIIALFMAIPAFAQSGAEIFKVRCAMCHGMDGAANTPAGKIFQAASFHDPAVIKISDEDRLNIVKNGKNKMPAFKSILTDDQIKSVLAYIRTLQKK